MSSPGSVPGASVWATRRSRATRLLGETQHAEEILTFYVALLEVQSDIAQGVPAEDWLALVRSEEDSPPLLRLDRLPLADLAPRFDDFLEGLAKVGATVIVERAQALLATEAAERHELLSAALASASDHEGATGLLARAFLEPIATTLAATDARTVPGPSETHCFACGSPPGVAALRDLPDALGSRSLVCSLCATEWRFPRLTCAHCGETKADQLLAHTAESVAHVRVDECKSCSQYMKTVDLRKRGDAVPLVDELATVELDLWAQERGLTKMRVNVLGL